MKKDMEKLEKQIEALTNIVKKDEREVTEMKKKELVEKVQRATTDEEIVKKDISKAKKGGSRKTTKKGSNKKKTTTKKTTPKKKTKKIDKEVKEIINDLEETKTLNAISEADTSLVTKTVNDLEEEIRNLYDDNTIVMKPVDEGLFKKKNVEENTKFTKIGPVTSGSAVIDKIDQVDEKLFSTLTKILFVIFMIMFIGVCAMIFYITIA
jgi:hypothetical protein